METRLTKYQDVEDAVIIDQPEEKKAFILGNTRGIELQNLQDDYLVPVFSRDNVETISHNDFINTVFDAAQTFYQGQQFLEPNIRVSHEMKLRTRKGSGKLVENLTDEDSGSYYQRMMFIIEIPSITYNIEGNDLTLQIVGVRSYSETNLLGNASQKQLFRVGVGFLNQVCTNMLLSTDGVKLDIKVTNTADLYKYCMELFSRYNYIKHVEEMRTLKNTFIDVTTFAQFLGKARMYQALPQSVKTDLQLPELILNEAGQKQPVDFVNTNNNHHVAIFCDASGNWQEHIVSFYEAVERANQHLPVIDKEYKQEEGWQFLFTMKQNEYFVFPNPATGFNPEEMDLKNPENYALISPNLFRVQALTKKDYKFRHHLETTVVDNNSLRDITWKRIRNENGLKGIVKVRKNHIGQIVAVGEY